MSSTSLSGRKGLDQGVSASRAGTAQKRPPGSAQRARPKSARVSVAGSASSRQSADESGDSSIVTRRPSAARVPPSPQRVSSQSASRPRPQTAAVEQDSSWASAERVLLDRTLRLHSLSPLHFSSLPATNQDVAPPLFQMLRAELHQYINLRLSDGLGFLEGADMVATSNPESGDLRPPAKRRRADMDKVGKVRIGFLKDGEFSRSLLDSRDGSSNAWVVEIELGKPTPTTTDDQSKSKEEEATPAELCHIVFIPAIQTQADKLHLRRSYPLIATKMPSATTAGGELLQSLTANIGPLVLGHALDWIQKRFDCRVSSATGATSIASQLRGHQLESLAELIVRQTRIEMGTQDGIRRTSAQRVVDKQVKPVELSFAFPATVTIAGGTAKVPGPAPELSVLTLTVPWEICMTLLETLPVDEPLLPALNQYLSAHTSIPLDTLELVKIGVAGVSVGSGRVKISNVPREQKPDANQSARQAKIEAVEPSDRRRAGAVFSFLSQIAQGVQP